MCFSAEASFIFATVLGTVGYFTLSEVRDTRQIPLAVLPLLFAVQQLCEGILWIFLNNHYEPNIVYYFCEYLYMLFGYVLWPTLFTVGALMLEDVPWRRTVISLFLLGALAMSIYNLRLVLTSGAQLAIVDKSIRYIGVTRYEGFAYLITVTAPFVFSSIPGLWLLGVMAPISFTISFYAYWNNFVSIWCLFAAMISIGLLFVIRAHSRGLVRAKRA